MINIGQFNTLTITRFTDHGAYVDGGEVGEILVPKSYVTKSMRPGDTLDLFVYLDQSERLVATTEQPLATVGDFAYLEVAWVNEHGAFLNWGVMKDLFVPFRQQKRTMEVGESYIVFVDIDEETGRLMATAKIDKHLYPAREHYYHRGEEVDLLVWQRTELGLKVIVDNRHAGLVYNDQLFAPEPKTGDRLRGTVVNVRPDGRIDVILCRCNDWVRAASATLPRCSTKNSKRSPKASCLSPTNLRPTTSPLVLACPKRPSSAQSVRSIAKRKSYSKRAVFVSVKRFIL